MSDEQNTEVVESATFKLSEMNVIQLTQLNQMLGRKIDELREQRVHLKGLLAARIAAGESEASIIAAADKAAAEPSADAQAVELQPGDAVAPGAVIEASASA